MKNIILSVVLFMFGFSVFSQKFSHPAGKFSIEAGYGISIPFGNVSSISNNSFISLTSFEIGTRYMLDDYWGLKGQFAYDSYQGANNIGSNFNRVDLQVYYNLGELLNLPVSTHEAIGLFVHSGFGLTSAQSLQQNNKDLMGNFIIGVSPHFQLNKTLSLTTDLNTVFNVKQSNFFDGYKLGPSEKDSGLSVSFLVGVAYYL
jgi:OmpA-OmpF porin, OOP family